MPFSILEMPELIIRTIYFLEHAWLKGDNPFYEWQTVWKNFATSVPAFDTPQGHRKVYDETKLFHTKVSAR